MKYTILDFESFLQKDKEDKVLRPLIKSDLPALLAIENAVHVLPWTEDTFNTCFQAGYIGWVAILDETIIGFVIISINQSECHILNLSVALDHQHQGYGRKLLNFALACAKEAGIGIAYLEVRRSNLKAISLYQKMNFHLVGERKNYYPIGKEHEDALVFAKSLHTESNL